MQVKRIHTSLPGSVPVDLAMCVVCDACKCPKCEVPTYITDPTAKRCPRGHFL